MKSSSGMEPPPAARESIDALCRLAPLAQQLQPQPVVTGLPRVDSVTFDARSGNLPQNHSSSRTASPRFELPS
jgi:hypothetical protein